MSIEVIITANDTIISCAMSKVTKLVQELLTQITSITCVFPSQFLFIVEKFWNMKLIAYYI